LCRPGPPVSQCSRPSLWLWPIGQPPGSSVCASWCRPRPTAGGHCRPPQTARRRARPPLSFLLPRGLFGVLICCICSMDGMLILFSLVFDRWTTTRTPPSELTDGSVVTGCTASVFPTCSRTCYTALATRRSPHVVTARTTSSCLGAARFIWTFRLIALTRP
jgi:hypothetical protein